MKNQWLRNKTLKDAKTIKETCLVSDYDILTKIMKYSDDTTADILQKMQKRTSSSLDLMKDAMVVYRLVRKPRRDKINEPKPRTSK